MNFNCEFSIYYCVSQIFRRSYTPLIFGYIAIKMQYSSLICFLIASSDVNIRTGKSGASLLSWNNVSLTLSLGQKWISKKCLNNVSLTLSLEQKWISKKSLWKINGNIGINSKSVPWHIILLFFDKNLSQIISCENSVLIRLDRGWISAPGNRGWISA